MLSRWSLLLWIPSRYIANSVVSRKSKLRSKRRGFRGFTKPLFFSAAPTQHSSTCISRANLSFTQTPANKESRRCRGFRHRFNFITAARRIFPRCSQWKKFSNTWILIISMEQVISKQNAKLNKVIIIHMFSNSLLDC